MLLIQSEKSKLGKFNYTLCNTAFYCKGLIRVWFKKGPVSLNAFRG